MVKNGFYNIHILLSFSLFLISACIILSSFFIICFNSILIVEWKVLSFRGGFISFPLIFDFINLIFCGVVFFISGNVIIFSNLYIKSELFIERFLVIVVFFIVSIFFLLFIPHLIFIKHIINYKFIHWVVWVKYQIEYIFIFDVYVFIKNFIRLRWIRYYFLLFSYLLPK